MFNFIKRLEKVEKTVDDLRLEMRGGLDIKTLDLWSLLGKPGKVLKAVPLPEQIKQLNSRISLLESHLNLTYIPASEEKKEARYEKKAEGLTLKFNPLSGGGHLCGKDCAVCRSMGPAGTSVGNPVGNPVGTRMSEWEASTRRPTQKIKKTKKK